MVNEDSFAHHNRCYCLFDCECEKVERLISDWTSLEALETVKNSLLSLSDPAEIFSRFACILFFRQILDGSVVKCTRDNLKKASIAFSFAASFVNEEIDCFSFYSSCWQRFQELASMLDENLSRINARRRLPLIFFVDEVFSLDSTDTTIAQLPSTEVTDDRNLDEPVQSRSDFTPGASLEDVHSQLDGQSILGAVQSLHSRQSEESVSKENDKQPTTESPDDADCAPMPPSANPQNSSESLEKEPVLSLDSNDTNHAHSLNSGAPADQNLDQFVQSHSDFTLDASLEKVHSQLNHSIPESAQSLYNRQIQNRSHARTGSMPSESAIKLAVKRSEIKEEEKKSKTETPVVANCVPMRPSANLQNSLESPGKKPKEEPVDSFDDDVVEVYVRLSNRSMPSPTARAQTVKRAVERDDHDGPPVEKRAKFDVENSSRRQENIERSEQRENRPSSTAEISKGASLSVANSAPIVDRSNWFKCPLSHCNAKLKFEWMIEGHLKRHTKQLAPYYCRQCGLDFIGPSSVSAHMSVHDKSNRFVCEICDFHYVRLDGLSRHRNKYHQDAECQPQSEGRGECEASTSGLQ